MTIETNTRATYAALLILIMVMLVHPTPRLFAQSTPLDGFTLFSPNNSRTTSLIDMNGNTVHSWSHSRTGGYSCYLLENGNLLRPSISSTSSINGAASAGLIQQFDWNGNLVWEFDYASSSYVTHHDLEPMPNGNVLAIAWEVKSSTEAAANGRSNAREMWPDHIIEIQPNGVGGASIVWEWHAWDHLIQDAYPSRANYGVVKDHPELFDINLSNGGFPGPGGGGDWMHINSISYNPIRDEIAITSHYFDEIYVIDHSTTTAQAAGHTGGNSGKGGDILYRWGYAQNYDVSGSNYFDVVHCAFWIPTGCPGAGNLMAFDNNATSHASEIVELVIPLDASGNYVRNSGSAFGPAAPVWTYSNGSTFYSNHLGGNQRLTNGNTLITESTSGYIFEVDAQGKEVWNHSIGKETARSLRYARTYPGVSTLAGTSLEVTLSAPAISIDWNSDSYTPMPFTVTATVKNTGTSTANNVYVTLSFEQLSALGFASPDSPANARKALSPLSLAPGNSNTVTYTVQHPVVNLNTQATIYALAEADNASDAQGDLPMSFPGLLSSTFHFLLSPATPLEFCDGGTAQIDAPGGYASYRWSNGDTTRSITVSQGGAYYCTVFDAGMKGLSDTVFVNIFPAPKPAIVASGSTTVCEGQAVMLDAGDGYANYLWNTSETTRTISVNTAGEYYVTVLDGNGCSGVSDTVLVQVRPAPRPVITAIGNTVLCEGDSVVLDAGAGYTGYLWNTQADSRTITVHDAGMYFVTVTDGNGCSGMSDSLRVDVVSMLEPKIQITGDPSMCLGDSIVLDAGAGYSTYLWNTQETSRTITVRDAGEFYVSVTSGNGCSGVSDTITTSVLPLPEPTIGIMGSLSFCEGDSIVLDAGDGYAGYLWNTQESSKTITVTDAGNYFVTVMNGNGCHGVSDTVTVSVMPAPVPAIRVTGSIPLCPGDSVVLDVDRAYATYLWNTQETTRSITVRTPGDYHVTVSDDNTCSGTSELLAVTLATLTKPLITRDGGLLRATSAVSWQWHRNGQPMPGETTQDLRLPETGIYTVEIVDEHGCAVMSDPYEVSVLDAETVYGVVSNFELYPNPSNGSFTVTLTTQSPQNISIAVTDMLGRLLYRKTTEMAMQITEKIDLTGYPSGPYFIRVALTDRILTHLITIE